MKKLQHIKFLKKIFLLHGGLLLFTSTFCQESPFNQSVTLNCNDCLFSEILSKIESQIHLGFAYNASLFDEEKKISFTANSIPLSTVLDSIINDSTIAYKVIGQQIVFYKISNESNFKNSEIAFQNKSIRISGRIIDKNTGEAIPFATIYIPEKFIGIAANSEGYFNFLTPRGIAFSHIAISCLGYKTLLIAMDKAIKQEVFELETDYISIQEVIIRKIEPLTLIRGALKKIEENYPSYPSILSSFYRETVKKNEQYMSITEAIIETYKTPYNKSEDDQIKILRGRKIDSFSQKDSLIMKMKGGLQTTLLLDIVKNLPDFLEEENFGKYNYKLADITLGNNRETYVIEFEQKKEIKTPLYIGKIFIDVESLAITQVDFSLNPLNIEEAWDRFVVKKPHWLKVRPVEANYHVEYRNLSNLWQLNQIRTETSFRIKNKKHLFSNLFSLKIETAVINSDTSEVKRFRGKELANISGIISDEFNQKTGIYWEDYNYILPDEPLDKAIEKIVSSGQKK